MRLTKEQRIEIILMAGSGSSRMVALNFNRKHGTNITHDTAAKLISKFKKTGNVADQPRSGPRRTATDENTTATIFTALVQSPRKFLSLGAFEVYGVLGKDTRHKSPKRANHRRH